MILRWWEDDGLDDNGESGDDCYFFHCYNKIQNKSNLTGFRITINACLWVCLRWCFPKGLTEAGRPILSVGGATVRTTWKEESWVFISLDCGSLCPATSCSCCQASPAMINCTIKPWAKKQTLPSSNGFNQASCGVAFLFVGLVWFGLAFFF